MKRQDPTYRNGRGALTGRRAFTLLELLVVLGIIGALAALTLPALKGLGRAGALGSAQRQFLDDLSLARQLAIKNRATVYMVFAPTNAWAHLETFQRLNPVQFRGYRDESIAMLTNIAAGSFATYALYTERRVGEQPGMLRPRYLTEWRALPEGFIFPQEMYLGPIPSMPAPATMDPARRVQQLPTGRFPFPMELRGQRLQDHLGTTSVWADPSRMPTLPYIAFDPTGRISDVTYTGRVPGGMLRDNTTRQAIQPGQDLLVAVTPGSVFLQRNPNGTFRPTGAPPDVEEQPRWAYTNGVIRISYFTGRARLIKPELP